MTKNLANIWEDSIYDECRLDSQEFVLLGCTDLKYRKCSSGENEIQDFEALTCDDCGMQCSEYRGN